MACRKVLDLLSQKINELLIPGKNALKFFCQLLFSSGRFIDFVVTNLFVNKEWKKDFYGNTQMVGVTE